jgi:photosystem II stability/assembly factor-like uncharacterized protein
MNHKIFIIFGLLLSGFYAAAQAESSIREIHMLDARNGWALAYQSNSPRVLRTTTGGESWKDVTPKVFEPDRWEYAFPSAKTAWISTSKGLVLTSDGGKTWAKAEDPKFYFNEGSQCRLVDAKHGTASTEDGGLGSSYYNFFDTEDCGLTWKPVTIVPPEEYKGSDVKPGTVHLSNICGDRIGYYRPGKVVIALGDLGDETPKGVVRLLVSNDLKSWRELRLSLPEKYRNGLVEPLEPVFFDEKRGLLPVQIVELPANTVNFRGLLFYATKDGGKTWTERSGPAGLKATGYQMEIVSAKDIFVCDGEGLLASHDGARSWRAFKPNIDFGRGNPRRYVLQLDFADATHGWIVIADSTKIYPNGEFFLYKTENGGKSWRELENKLKGTTKE